jgi:polar amino acid transport system substrate-binding protein
MRLWPCFLMCFLLIPAISHAAVEIRTAAQESSEPKYLLINRNGQSAIGGICVDIFRAIEKQNPEIKFTGDQVWMPRMRIDAHFRDNLIDAICGVQDIARNTAQYQLLSTPLFSVEYLLAVRADDTININNWNDIRLLGENGIILAIRGFGIVDIIDNIGGLKVDASATSSISNLRKLLAGRGRFYCHRSPGIKMAIKSAGLEQQIKLLKQPLHTEKFYLGLRKNLPEIQVKLIEDALHALHKNGELKRIFDNYRE